MYNNNPRAYILEWRQLKVVPCFRGITQIAIFPKVTNLTTYFVLNYYWEYDYNKNYCKIRDNVFKDEARCLEEVSENLTYNICDPICDFLRKPSIIRLRRNNICIGKVIFSPMRFKSSRISKLFASRFLNYPEFFGNRAGHVEIIECFFWLEDVDDISVSEVAKECIAARVKRIVQGSNIMNG